MSGERGAVVEMQSAWQDDDWESEQRGSHVVTEVEQRRADQRCGAVLVLSVLAKVLLRQVV